MSTMTLTMPSNYVEIEREEMEYVDGGDNYIFTSILTLGSLAITMGMFMWNIGSKHEVTELQSRGILTAIFGASVVGSACITYLEKTAWDTIKVYFSGFLMSGGDEGYYA